MKKTKDGFMRAKEILEPDENYIEIDMTKEEIGKLLQGYFSSTEVIINGKKYRISVGDNP